jgi:N-acetylneuraminate synthase
MINKIVKFDGCNIGRDYPPYIVAELSANHAGDINVALDSVLAAKKAGASAIKLQTYTADSMTIDSLLPEFLITDGLWKGSSLYELYKKAEMPIEWHKEIFRYAREIGITCFSTPFDEAAVDLLEELDVPGYKVASFEAVDLPLIRYIAGTGKPMFMSTGMANFDEISEMVQTARDAGCDDLVILHCISGYPTPYKDFNLRTMVDIQEKFDVLVGLSDHSLNNTVALAATSLGAVFIEKHFMINNELDSPDSSFSILPEQLEALVNETHNIWLSLGDVSYERQFSEKANLKFRRSLYFIQDITKGEVIKRHHIKRIRPGYGLPPKFQEDLIGKRAKEMIKAGTAATFELVE